MRCITIFFVDTFKANAPSNRIELELDFEDGWYYEERLVLESDVEEVREYMGKDMDMVLVDIWMTRSVVKSGSG